MRAKTTSWSTPRSPTWWRNRTLPKVRTITRKSRPTTGTLSVSSNGASSPSIGARLPSELRYGDSVWQIERYTLRLAKDFRRRRWDAADHDAVFAAHYAADLTQPLHTVINYDGQLTNQRGIHARFETELVRDLAGRWTLRPQPAEVVPDLRARIFRELVASYSDRQVIFSADREAAAGGGYLDPQFPARFERLAGPLALRQLDAAAALVSSFWYTAWVRAGRPVLPRVHRAPQLVGARTGEGR